MKESEINKWLALIVLSQKEREHKQPNWDLFLDYFRGLQWQQDKMQNEDIVTVNLVFSTIKVIIPSIYFRNPKLFMEAIKPSAVYRARIQQAVLNQDMVIMDMKSEIKKMLIDVILLGTSWSKTTYYTDYQETSPEPGDQGQILSLVEKFQGGPIASAEDQNVDVGKNGPQSIRVSPYNVAFRVGAHDPRDPGFIAHGSLLYLEDIKNDSYYHNTDGLQPTVVTSDKIRMGIGSYWGDDAEASTAMVKVWEVWDPNKERKCLLAEGHSKALREWEENPYPYDHPFDLLKFTIVPDEMWGMSEIEPWLPQQDELNKYRTMHSIHTKRFNRKYMIRKGSILSDEQKDNLQKGTDGAIVEFDTDDVRKELATIPDAPMSTDIYNFMGMVKDDIVEIGGITPYKRGILRGAKTATEASIADNNSQFRDAERIDVITEFVNKIMRKVRLCRKEFTPGEYIVQVTDDQQAGQLWEVWSKESFTEDVYMSIQYGSTLPINTETKRQDAVLLYDRLIQNPTIRPDAAAVKLLDAYEEKDLATWFLPPEMIQQQMVNKAIADQATATAAAAQAGQAQAGQGKVPGQGAGTSVAGGIKGVAPTSKGGEPQGQKTPETSAELGGTPLRVPTIHPAIYPRIPRRYNAGNSGQPGE